MRGALVGYARVSSTDQDLATQLEALQNAGCEKIFAEKVSGTSTKDRFELEKCLAYIRDGDTLVVTRMDRLGRSVLDILKMAELLSSRGVNFKCLLQPVFDINESTGKLFFVLLAAFAEFETTLRKERQMEGINRARAAGKLKGGSKPKWSKTKVIAAATELVQKHNWGATEVAKHLKMHVRTLYRYTSGHGLWRDLPKSLQRDVPTYNIDPDDAPAQSRR